MLFSQLLDYYSGAVSLDTKGIVVIMVFGVFSALVFLKAILKLLHKLSMGPLPQLRRLSILERSWSFHENHPIRKRLGAFALQAFKRPAFFLAITAAVTVLAIFFTSKLKIDTDLSTLLPSDFQSVQDLQVVKEHYGGEGYLVVVARNAPPEKLKRFADDFTLRVSGMEEVEYVEKGRPVTFLEERALYFLDLQDLETLRDRVTERVEWELIQANPFFVDLLDRPPPSLALEELQQKYAVRWGSLLTLRDETNSYYFDPQLQMIAVLIKPEGLASNLRFAQTLTGKVQSVLDEMDLKSYDPNLRVDMTGRYKKRVDLENQIRRDMGVVTLAALLAMLVYLAMHFRRATPLGLVFLPLTAGLLWTFGFASVAIGTLNILTAFIGSILLGFGMDHGLHLLGHYQSAVRKYGQDDDRAIVETFSKGGMAVFIAAATTTVAFAGLMISQFKVFYQFGAIAGVGMILMVLAYFVVLPALLSLARRTGWAPPIQRPVRTLSYGTLVKRHAPKVLAGFLVFAALAATGIPRADFDDDFSSLDDGELPSYMLDKTVNSILGHSQTPLFILTPRREMEQTYAAAVREHKSARGNESSVDFVLSGSDLVPGRQEEKSRIIQEIGESLEKLDRLPLDPEQQAVLDRLKRLARATPFTPWDLPQELVRKIYGVNGLSEGGVVLIYPAVELTRGHRVVQLSDELRDIRVSNGDTIRAAGEAMILADMLRMVFRDGIPVLVTTLALVFITMWLMWDSLWKASLCMLPAGFTLLTTTGLSGYLGIDFNYLNVIIIPILVGLGVDGGVHLLARIQEGSGLAETLQDTGRSIRGALFTTALGFGALTLAHHPGLSSVGQMALLGLTMNWAASLLGFAALLCVLHRKTAMNANALSPALPHPLCAQRAVHCKPRP